MSTLEEVQKMQSEGAAEQEIMLALQSKGVPSKEIDDALAQSRIKDAVSGSIEHTAENSQESASQEQSAEQYQGYQTTGGNYESSPGYDSSQTAEYSQQYQPYQSGGISSDTITEIAEQIVMERMMIIKKDVEKISDIKTTMQTKLEYIDERLKRIEKIIDRLQLSVLQKVGEYVNNVSDLKKELLETQKTVEAVSTGKHHKHHHASTHSQESQHQHTQHHQGHSSTHHK